MTSLRRFPGIARSSFWYGKYKIENLVKSVSYRASTTVVPTLQTATTQIDFLRIVTIMILPPFYFKLGNFNVLKILL